MSLFPFGRVEITSRAAAALAAANLDPADILARHTRGDWGDVDERTRQDNDLAVAHGQLIRSFYRLSDEDELLVVTDADRAYTGVLLADEYRSEEVSARKGYAVWAGCYDQEKNILFGIEEPRVDALLRDLPVTSALDVGTGTGRYALRLARRGVTVVGVDQSPEMLARAQAAARADGLEVHFQRATLGDGLPFKSKQFDLLVCALTLCHIPDLAGAAREFHRVLQRGGHVLITDFHPAAVEIGWRTQFHHRGRVYLLPNAPHTRADYVEALAAPGFRLLHVLDVPLYEVPEGYLAEETLRLHGDKRVSLIILAQKPADP